MHDDDEDLKFRLTVPLEDAFAFSMGGVPLHSTEASDVTRQLIGVLIIDALQYGEHWRVAAQARASLAERWPECAGFRSNGPG